MLFIFHLMLLSVSNLKNVFFAFLLVIDVIRFGVFVVIRCTLLKLEWSHFSTVWANEVFQRSGFQWRPTTFLIFTFIFHKIKSNHILYCNKRCAPIGNSHTSGLHINFSKTLYNLWSFLFSLIMATFSLFNV